MRFSYLPPSLQIITWHLLPAQNRCLENYWDDDLEGSEPISGGIALGVV